MSKSVENNVKQTTRVKRKIFRKGDISLYLMALPAVVLLLLFCYFPMAGLVLAFKKYRVADGIFGSKFVGLDNFKFLFSTSDAYIITRNTIVFNITFLIVNTLLAILFSLLLNELRNKKAAKVLQTIYMLPYFLSWAVVAIVVSAFLDRSHGLVNGILKILGREGLIDWYKRIEIWPFLLVFINAWKYVGYNTVVYLAVISGISSDYYEAAVLDGATRFQQAKYITIPHLRFIISISLIMSMGGIFRGDFGLFYTVTQNTGALYNITNVIDVYIYNGLQQGSNIGMTTAAGMYQSVVGLIFLLVANKIVAKIDPESSMF